MYDKTYSTLSQIKKLWGLLFPRRKRQLFVLLFLMITASLAEVLSIGAVLPFLGILAAPEKVLANELVRPLILVLKIETPQDLLLPFTLIFITAAIIAGLIRIFLLWGQTRLSLAIGTDLSLQVYERMLYQPYSSHIMRNSSEVLAGLQKTNGLVGCLLQPVLTVVSSLLILLTVFTSLLVIQPGVALAIFLGFGLIYSTIVFITKRHIANNSRILAIQQGRVNKAVQEGLGGIRDILIDGTQAIYCRLFKGAFVPMTIASASNQVTAASPRFGVESLGLAFIAGLAYMLSSTTEVESSSAANVFPVLGALALGAQRLLPLLQQSYGAYITIKGNQAGVQDALDLFAQPPPTLSHAQEPQPITFRHVISLVDLGFRYSTDRPWVIRHINLQIPKGSRVGFIGTTGSGKSTLLDIVMALLPPTEGMLTVDGTQITSQNMRAWQAHISHVPQSIFLADTSFAENIAFGVPTEIIDMQRVQRAAQQAQIVDYIESLPDSYNTLVGERGIRLSGGQRQRIGIARALYKKADVIIFDEATSALDSETEANVMKAVERLGHDLTILIIAHRLTTLKNCDFIVTLVDSGIASVRRYEEINCDSEGISPLRF